jgi:hypothetical protein
VTDDPSILYTTAIAVLIGAVAVLRTFATEREHRVKALKLIAESERARQEQKRNSD